MKNLIVYFLSILINIYVFGQIYLFWIKRIRLALQKHYSMVISDAAALEHSPSTWKSVSAELQINFYTSKSLIPALHRDISTSTMTSAFLQRNFPTCIRHISKWKCVGLDWRIVTSVLGDGKSKWKSEKSKWKDISLELNSIVTLIFSLSNHTLSI